MESKSKGKVAWNASEGLIMEISNRRNMANTYYINNNLGRAMQTLITIKQSTVQSFNKEERTKLKEIEERFSKVSGLLNLSSAHSFNFNLRESYNIANSIAIKIYMTYNDCLMDLLDKYGYLIGEQSDASQMKF